MKGIHEILTKYWGYNHFRPLQEEIIYSVLDQKDSLALLPTGGGKSICFQVPAIRMEGICIVISPLIALMKDQVANLQEKGIKAIALTSEMGMREIDIALDNCIYGDIKFLYISPERLQSELVKVRIPKMKVNLLAVDEAHCISQWGYDFRPAYLEIAEIRKLLPNTPVLALTATATQNVVKDIQEKLFFKKENVFQKSFERKNLAYVVVKEENKLNRLLKILDKISGSAIVYTRKRKNTEEIAKFLRSKKIEADFYHAGVPHQVRTQKQEAWTKNDTRVMVSTNAFGMGIDKGDVRLVVHMSVPNSIEAYFQEAGRAGRDEEKAYAILLYHESDRLELEKNIQLGYPEAEEIKKVYQALGNHFQLAVGAGKGTHFNFNITEFSSKYEFNALHVFNCIKLLEKEGVIALSESSFTPSRLHVNSNKEELYRFQVKNKAFDEFIKVLLRSYTGLFDNFVHINEHDLAKRFGKDDQTVQNMLLKLAEYELITYYPQTQLPQITFLTERLDVKDLHIAKEHLAERQERAVKRMEWVVHYASSDHKCRSQLLLSYFGEEDAYRCGVCDVCLERNKLNLSNLEFENVSEQIKKILSEEAFTLTALVNQIQSSREDKTLKVIQWLLDNNKLKYDEEQKLHWLK